MKTKLTTLVAILGYLLMMSSCSKSDEEVGKKVDPVNGMVGVTVSAVDPTIGYTTLELKATLSNYEDSLEAGAEFVLYDGETVVEKKSFTDLENTDYALEAANLTSGKEYQYDFTVTRGSDVVTTGKQKVTTQKVATNFTVEGGFTSLKIAGDIEGILENTKITVLTEVMDGDKVVKSTTEDYTKDVMGLAFSVTGLELGTDYKTKVTVKDGDAELSSQEYNNKTHTFSVSSKDVSNNQGGLYMEGTFTSDIEPNDEIALGFYYKKATDSEYSWMDAEMLDKTNMVAVGLGLEIGVAYDVKTAVKIFTKDTVFVSEETKNLEELHGGVFVDVAATGTGDGTSWENAFTSIKTAIERTEETIGDVKTRINVLIKKGEYFEKDPFKSSSAFLDFYGGFGNDNYEKIEDRKLSEHKTILNFLSLRIANETERDSTRIVSGLTITNTPVSNLNSLIIIDGNYLIEDCIFMGASVGDNADGIVTSDHYSYNKLYTLTIVNCKFENLVSGYLNSGLFGAVNRILKIENVEFHNVKNPFNLQYTGMEGLSFHYSNIRFTGNKPEYLFKFQTDGDFNDYNSWAFFNNVCKSAEMSDVTEVFIDQNNLSSNFDICN